MTKETNIPAEKAEQEMVSIPKVQLDNILERLNTIEGKKQLKRASFGNKICRVRFVGPEDKRKMVIGYGKSWEENVLGVGKVLKIEVIDEDNKKQVVDFVDFNEKGYTEQAEIIRVKVEESEESVGVTTLKKVDYDNFTTEDTGIEKDMVVKNSHSTYTVKLPSGKQVDLDETAVN